MTTETERLVTHFMPEGVLLRMPAKHAKRQVLLGHIAQRFEPGVRYPEKQVDEILRSVTDAGESDHVTLRRYLVDSCLLAREAGEYWRTGGRVAGS